MRIFEGNVTAAALAGLLLLAAPATAGDFGRHGGWNGPHLPSVTRWGDTYAGAVSAASFRHGTYFYVDRDALPLPVQRERRPTVRIVDAGKSQCAYEAGVCVIRPRH